MKNWRCVQHSLEYKWTQAEYKWTVEQKRRPLSWSSHYRRQFRSSGGKDNKRMFPAFAFQYNAYQHQGGVEVQEWHWLAATSWPVEKKEENLKRSLLIWWSTVLSKILTINHNFTKFVSVWSPSRKCKPLECQKERYGGNQGNCEYIWAQLRARVQNILSV